MKTIKAILLLLIESIIPVIVWLFVLIIFIKMVDAITHFKKLFFMKYEQLTLMQRIGLKGEIKTNSALQSIKLIWIFWNFKKAVEFFLNEDINELD